MRRVVTTALVSLLCPGMLLLTGCSDDKPAAQPPVSSVDGTTTTSSAPVTTEPPDAHPTAPVMPERAKQHTTAGAKAFVRYYIDVLNYSNRSITGRDIRSVSAPDCEVCDSIADFEDEIRRNGGSQKGGEWTPMSLALMSSDSPREMNIASALTVAASAVRKTRGGKLYKTPIKRRIHVDFYLEWQHRWLLTDLIPT